MKHLKAAVNKCKTDKCRVAAKNKLKLAEKMHESMEKVKANKNKISEKDVHLIEENTQKFIKKQEERTKKILAMIKLRTAKEQDMIKQHTKLMKK